MIVEWDENGKSFIAYDDTTIKADGRMPIMGTADLHWHDDIPPSVWSVHTAEKYRRQGVARSIMTAIIDECRQRGAESIGLHCVEGNAPAENLYASLGFLKHPTGKGERFAPWWVKKLGGN